MRGTTLSRLCRLSAYLCTIRNEFTVHDDILAKWAHAHRSGTTLDAFPAIDFLEAALHSVSPGPLNSAGVGRPSFLPNEQSMSIALKALELAERIVRG